MSKLMKKKNLKSWGRFSLVSMRNIQSQERDVVRNIWADLAHRKLPVKWI